MIKVAGTLNQDGTRRVFLLEGNTVVNWVDLADEELAEYGEFVEEALNERHRAGLGGGHRWGRDTR